MALRSIKAEAIFNTSLELDRQPKFLRLRLLGVSKFAENL